MQISKPELKPLFLVFWSLWILWGFGYETVWRRLTIEINGVVLSSEDVPVTRGSRYITRYTLSEAEGRTQVYVAGASDASLPRSLPIGTHLKKQMWHLSYEKDDQTVDSFPLLFYGLMLIGAACLLAWSIRLWHRQSRPSLRLHAP